MLYTVGIPMAIRTVHTGMKTSLTIPVKNTNAVVIRVSENKHEKTPAGVLVCVVQIYHGGDGEQQIRCYFNLFVFSN